MARRYAHLNYRIAIILFHIAYKHHSPTRTRQDAFAAHARQGISSRWRDVDMAGERQRVTLPIKRLALLLRCHAIFTTMLYMLLLHSAAVLCRRAFSPVTFFNGTFFTALSLYSICLSSASAFATVTPCCLPSLVCLMP